MYSPVCKAKQSAPALYQAQKVHIEDLVLEESVETFERDLKKSLTKYGHILDIKILQNREMSRRSQVLRFRHV